MTNDLLKIKKKLYGDNWNLLTLEKEKEYEFFMGFKSGDMVFVYCHSSPAPGNVLSKVKLFSSEGFTVYDCRTYSDFNQNYYSNYRLRITEDYDDSGQD